MRAAVLAGPGLPVYGVFPEPTPTSGHAVVEVSAAGLNPIDIAVAAGRIPEAQTGFPRVAGHEGVGLVGGRRMYFGRTKTPFGAMGERALAPEDALFEVHDEVPDDLAVALGTSGVAAWLSLTARARLCPGETVLVLGATGVVGTLAVQLARIRGAGRIVAAGRAADSLAAAHSRGADALVDLNTTGDLTTAFLDAAGGPVDVVIDPIWGPAAIAALGACAPYGRHVQIGQAAAPVASLSSGPFRARGADLLAYSNAYASPAVQRTAYATVLEYAARGELTVDIERIPLAEVKVAWQRQNTSAHRKLVLIP